MDVVFSPERSRMRLFFQINEISKGSVNDFTGIHVQGVYSRWSEKLQITAK